MNKLNFTPFATLCLGVTVFATGVTFIHKLNIKKPADLREYFSYSIDRIPLISTHRGGGYDAGFVENNLWENAVQGYIASITFADAQIGRLLDALDNSKYKQNTIIVLFGDHGWNLGEKEHWRKFALWEETTHVPFIISAPGMVKPNSVCDRTVNLMDIYPTLIEMCSFPVKKGMEAVSIFPLLKNPKLEWNHPSVSTWGRNNHSVRTERWRYIRYSDGGEELYDHNIDPHEWKNLASDPKLADIKKQLAAWMPRVNAENAPSENRDGNDGE